MPFFDADDAAIYYESEGKGKPLVLLHGYALNGLMWQFQRAHLGESNRLVIPDLRGFGKSSCGKNWSPEQMAQDIKGLTESLQLKDVTVLGFSMSGPVALMVAYQVPDIVTELILVSPILPPTGHPRARREKEITRQEMQLLRLSGVNAWAENIGLTSGPLVDNMFRRNRQVRPLWQRIIARHNPDFLLCMMSARENEPSSMNWRSKLNEITQPTLIIAGAQDSQFVDSAHYLARKIPHSKLKLIKGAGHMVNLEVPNEFNRVVSKFLLGR